MGRVHLLAVAVIVVAFLGCLGLCDGAAECLSNDGSLCDVDPSHGESRGVNGDDGDGVAEKPLINEDDDVPQSRVDFIDAIAALYVDHNLTRGVELLQASANGGEPRAYWMLAAFHSWGIGVPVSQSKAVLYHTFAAMGGVPESHAALFTRYRYGIGVARDCRKASFHGKAVADSVAAARHKDLSPMPTLKLLNAASSSGMSRKGLGLVATLLQMSSAETSRNSELMQHHTYRAERGEKSSQMFLAYSYLLGNNGVKQSGKRAQELLESAQDLPAVHGILGQLYLQGMQHSDPPIPADPERALREFRQGADLDDPVSLNGMGYIHATGAAGVKRDFAAARKYFARASDAGNAEATYNLALLFLHGKGGPQDERHAASLLMRAHASGSVLATWQLGTLHHSGKSPYVSQSCSQSVEYFRKVLEVASWSRLLSSGYDSFQDGDYFSSFLDYVLASEVGYRRARWNLVHLLTQRTVPVASTAAIPDNGDIVLFRMAQDASDGKLPSVFLEPEDAIENLVLAIMERSAEAGDADGHLKIGDCYYHGTGTPANLQRAIDHYQIAAESGSSQARWNLAVLHQLNGEGALAKRYYDQLALSPEHYVASRLGLWSLNVYYWLRHFASNDDGSISVTRAMQSFFGGFWNHVCESLPLPVAEWWLPASELFTQGTICGYAWDDCILVVCVPLLILLCLLRNYIVHR